MTNTSTLTSSVISGLRIALHGMVDECQDVTQLRKVLTFFGNITNGSKVEETPESPPEQIKVKRQYLQRPSDKLARLLKPHVEKAIKELGRSTENEVCEKLIKEKCTALSRDENLNRLGVRRVFQKYTRTFFRYPDDTYDLH